MSRKSAIETIEHATYGATREALQRLGYEGVALERTATIITDAVVAAADGIIEEDAHCPTCAALGFTCLACRALPPSPPEKGNGNRCVCGVSLRRRVGGWGCPGCGSAFIEETNNAKR